MNSPIERCVARQKTYFETGQTRPLSFRRAQLKKLQQLVRENESRIAEALHSDLGKSAFEAYATETGLVLKEIALYLRKTKRWAKRRNVRGSLEAFPSKSFLLPEPKGVCLIIAPWNYPFQLSIAPLIAAIAAGNCAVIKTSEISVHTSALIEDIVNQAFADDYIHVINGDVAQSTELLKQPFDLIFFTGSPAVGKIVMKAASEQLIPVVLELGGKSPVIVEKSADIALAAKRIIWGKSINAGQTCIAPDYVLVEKSIEAALTQAMKQAIAELFGSDLQKSPDYPRIINRRHYERIRALMNDGKLIFGGESNAGERFIALSLIAQPSMNSALMQEEIFGPILPIVTFNSIDQAIQLIKTKPKPLALYVFSKRKEVVNKLMHSISAGGITINDTIMHFANSALPFGGTGFSGMGAYHGKAGFDVFSHLKPIMKRGLWLDIPLRYPPFGKKLRWLKWVMK